MGVMSDALRRPACSILLGCLIWAAVPLFISATGGFSAPFLFCFFLRAGGSLAALSFVLSRPRTSLCLRCLVSPRLVCLALGKLVYGFMAWSMAFIPPQVGVLAHGTWPMIFVLGLTGLRRESLPALGLMAVCLAGFALMTLSGGVPGLPYSRGTLAGLALAGASALLDGSHNSVSVRWGRSLDRSGDLGFQVLVNLLGQLCSVPVCLGLALLRGEFLPLASWPLALLCGVLVGGVGHPVPPGQRRRVRPRGQRAHLPDPRPVRPDADSGHRL